MLLCTHCLPERESDQPLTVELGLEQFRQSEAFLPLGVSQLGVGPTLQGIKSRIEDRRPSFQS
jgi:hypothetical protein